MKDIEVGGDPHADWVKSSSLGKLMPSTMLRETIDKPELSSFTAKLAWVRTRMEYARGVEQSQAFLGSRSLPKAVDKDVDMGSLSRVGKRDTIWSLTADALAQCAKDEDWCGYAEASASLNAIAKARGKGGKPSFGKGGVPDFLKGKGKGAVGEGEGGGKAGKAGGKGFKGTCWTCGKAGHRAFECPEGLGVKEVDEEPCAEGEEDAAQDDDWWVGGGAYSLSIDEEGFQRPRWRQQHASKGRSMCSTCPCAIAASRFSVLAGDGEEPPHVDPADFPALQLAHASVAGDRDSSAGGSKSRDAAWMQQLAHSDASPTTQMPACVGRRRARRKWAPVDLAMLGWVEAGDAVPTEDALNQVDAAPEGLEGDGYWIEGVVDSGAVTSVAKRGTFPGSVKPSRMSRQGKRFKSASGHRIPNEGQQNVRFFSQEGHKCGLCVQVADVDATLIAPADLTKAGNKIELEETHGTLRNLATGRTIHLPRRGNKYLLRMWVRSPGKTGFPRQGSP